MLAHSTSADISQKIGTSSGPFIKTGTKSQRDDRCVCQCQCASVSENKRCVYVCHGVGNRRLVCKRE